MRGYFCIGFIYFWLTLSAPQGVGGGGGGKMYHREYFLSRTLEQQMI